jgi:predicted DsbA family dithiol-disulfide isomerase
MESPDDPSVAPAEPALVVYSDYVCPFCYLGRQSLARYQDTREEPLRIDWRPFDLRANERGPDGEIDPERDSGKDEAYFERARENVRRLAETYDVEMTLELAMDVDSLDAQVVSYHLTETHPYETWLAFDEAVFEALWRDGRDVGDPAVLRDVAAGAGVDGDVVRTALADGSTREALTERFRAARRRGVTGVPTFAYDDHAARGAVPPDQLRRLVEGA